ncbi:MAG: arylsulfatase [Verrucomicrobiia bacterium]|jgi:arylsulfatase A-like enzyme
MILTRMFHRLVLIAAALALPLAAAETSKPNIIFILADDLGRGDLGCYGQKKIRTPNLDRMAAEGARFTQAYSGTSVCAPSRGSLMTGRHIGHAIIRANREYQPEGQEPLPAGTFTVAALCRSAGYKTAAFGKWGLGFVDSTGAPDKMGFDLFFGYNCQRQAHNYYPDHLWRNRERVELDGKTYSHDLIAKEALQWVRANAGSPFFLYLAFTIPHARYQVPDLGPYANESWPEPMKAYAAMITRLDADIGRLLALLKELGLDGKTLVMFASDNGQDNKNCLELFQSNGPLRGSKRTMYEGGIRVPGIARWPGRIKPGTVNATPWAFYDFLPTVAELISQPLPDDAKTDGTSIAPALLNGETMKRDFLYWELHEPRFMQAVRLGDWKAARHGLGAPIELYDLAKDVAEARDIAADHPDIVQRADTILKREHVESSLWPDKPAAKPSKGKGKRKNAGTAKK